MGLKHHIHKLGYTMIVIIGHIFSEIMGVVMVLPDGYEKLVTHGVVSMAMGDSQSLDGFFQLFDRMWPGFKLTFPSNQGRDHSQNFVARLYIRYVSMSTIIYLCM